MSDKPVNESIREMMVAACHTYDQRGERAALRCALGDAAGICDAMAREIETTHRTRNGKGPVSANGQNLAAIVRVCGDRIFAARDLIGMPS